jgi:hypothetical protein
VGKAADDVTEFQMDDRIRSFDELLEYRIAIRRFESAFEACVQLPDEKRQLLLMEVAKRVSQQLQHTPSEEQTEVKVIGIKIKQT